MTIIISERHAGEGGAAARKIVARYGGEGIENSQTRAGDSTENRETAVFSVEVVRRAAVVGEIEEPFAGSAVRVDPRFSPSRLFPACWKCPARFGWPEKWSTIVGWMAVFGELTVPR